MVVSSGQVHITALGGLELAERLPAVPNGDHVLSWRLWLTGACCCACEDNQQHGFLKIMEAQN